MIIAGISITFVGIVLWEVREALHQTLAKGTDVDKLMTLILGMPIIFPVLIIGGSNNTPNWVYQVAAGVSVAGVFLLERVYPWLRYVSLSTVLRKMLKYLTLPTLFLAGLNMARILRGQDLIGEAMFWVGAALAFGSYLEVDYSRLSEFQVEGLRLMGWLCVLLGTYLIYTITAIEIVGLRPFGSGFSFRDAVMFCVGVISFGLQGAEPRSR